MAAAVRAELRPGGRPLPAMAAPGRAGLLTIGLLTALAGGSIGAAATDADVEQCQSEIRTENFRIQVAQVAFGQLNDTAAAGTAQHTAAIRELAQSRAALRDAENVQRQVEHGNVDLRAQIAEAEQNATRARESEDAARQSAASARQSVVDLQRQVDQGNVSARGVAPVGGGGWGVSAFFRTFAYQKLLALAIGAAGLLSALDAALFAQCVAVGATAVAVGIFADGTANEAWQGELGDVETFLVGVEGAVITVVAAHVGFEGFELVVGVCLALCAAHVAARWAGGDSWQPHATFAWFALSTVLGVSLMQGGQKAACAVIGSIGGGLMAASSCAFFWFSFMNAAGVSSPCWIDFVGVLQSSGAASQDFTMLRHIGHVVWFAVASLGASRYFLGVPVITCLDRSGRDAKLDDDYESLAG